ncbi:GDP-mannose 4,6-dehydratase [Schlesneria sp. T3-172]|uniref:GDP-mannose 4,6-dehydratase n=1 Tax=Schlesneria sphaerica TaxID=3373610 RepID=UPI0037C84DFE
MASESARKTDPSGSRTVVVLGANSFSGQDFIDLLLDDPRNRVIGISRSPERSSLFLKYLQSANRSHFTYHRLDLNNDSRAILNLLDAERPEWVVNFAAQSEVAPSWDYPEDWFQTNCVALAELVNHLRRQNYLQRYLHISSPEVYGSCVGRVTEDAPMNPSTPYAASKAAADLLLTTFRKQFDFPVLTVRATNVYGARQQLFKIIPRSAIYLLTGKTIELHGGGRAVKSYIHIRDVSRGELAILEHGQIGQMYHLSPDQGISVREVVQRMCATLGRSFEESTKSVDERPGQDAAYVIDSSRARTELNWKPQIDLDTGLREVVDWVQANLEAIEQLPLSYIHRP